MGRGNERIRTRYASRYDRSRSLVHQELSTHLLLTLKEAASRRGNVQAITAYMPEAFGTHHSKMIILFRHDDLAQ